MNYRPEIDGLRALAVVPVILFHAGFPQFSGGYIGVDVFFVISGYLITTILITELQSGQFSLVRFYERRARRILPALFLVVAVSLFAGWFILFPADLEQLAMSVVAVATFLSNFFFWSESGYFDTSTELKPLLHTWSLAVEEQYYIFFPILLAALWRFGNRVLISVLVSVLALSLSVVLFDLGAISEKEAAFYLLPGRAWELMIGALISVLYVRNNFKSVSPAVAGSLSALGMSFILYAVFFFDENTPFPSHYTLIPTIGTALIILFEKPNTWSFRLLSNPICIGVGLVSYSAYLWHQPLFAYTRYLSLEEPSHLLMAGLSALTFLLAYLSFRFVETPFRIGSRFSRSQIFKYSGAMGSVLVTMSLFVSWNDGAPHRFDKRHIAVFEQFVDPSVYVNELFNSHRLAEFNHEDTRHKLLILGDSFAQDVTNAVGETSLSGEFQISTYYIPARCGNLYLDRDFSEFVAAHHRRACSKENSGYKNKTLQARIGEADEIWLASQWRDWQIDLLPESIENLRKTTDARIRVIGTKNFGASMSLKLYMAEFQAGNRDIVVPISDHGLETNRKLQNTLPKEELIDILVAMCGAGVTCRNTTDDGLLISYDGGHLTAAGAEYMGSHLQNLLN